MDIYNYSPFTGEFLGKTKARLDPIEQKPMVPKNATTIAPPRTKKGHVRVFSDEAWSQVADHRGQEYWQDGKSYVIEELGAVVPEGASIVAPLPNREHLKKQAMHRIDQFHSQMMLDLTGNPTNEERNTWPRKLMAALAIDSGDTSELHLRALREGAVQRGLSAEEFAAVIIAKDSKFASLQDIADATRGMARAAVAKMFDEIEDIQAIQAALDKLFADLLVSAQSEIEEWQNAS